MSSQKSQSKTKLGSFMSATSEHGPISKSKNQKNLFDLLKKREAFNQHFQSSRGSLSSSVYKSASRTREVLTPRLKSRQTNTFHSVAHRSAVVSPKKTSRNLNVQGEISHINVLYRSETLKEPTREATGGIKQKKIMKKT